MGLFNFAPHLCMTPCSQGLAAPLTAQTWPMPVLPQRRHLLGCQDTIKLYYGSYY